MTIEIVFGNVFEVLIIVAAAAFVWGFFNAMSQDLHFILFTGQEDSDETR